MGSCSATARAFTLRARKPDAAAFSASLIPIDARADDWMNFSFGGAEIRLLRHIIETLTDVRLSDLDGQFLKRVDLEMPDAGVASGKAISHAIGHVCKTDRQFILGRNTASSCPCAGRMSQAPASAQGDEQKIENQG